MAKLLLLFGVPVVYLVLAADPVTGRLRDDWPYERLMKEADLVVIAIAKSSEDTEDQPTDAEARKNKLFVGRTTILEVRGTLKGKATEEIKVLHFRLNVVEIDDGPLLAEFRTGSTTVKAKGHAKVSHPQVEYLLFLKARKDGRYEPVSGQYDSGQSVREVYPPPPSGR